MTKNKNYVPQEPTLETLLLSQAGQGDVLQQKLCDDIEQEITQAANHPTPAIITEFSLVPQGKIFSFHCFFSLYNRKTKVNAIIHGVQVESLIGLDTALFNKLKNRDISAFCIGDYYIKFLNFKTAT